jgi:hypothetical protein
MLGVSSGVMLVLRFFHIVAGSFWFGSAALFAAFLGPAAAEVGPSAGPVMANMVVKRHVSKVISGAGAITVLAGLTTYLIDWNDVGSFGDWIGSSFGLVLTIGAIAAIGAFFSGFFGVGRNVERMVALDGRVAESGWPPTPEQGQEMGRLQAEIKKHSITDLILLLVAVSAMATARYW